MLPNSKLFGLLAIFVVLTFALFSFAPWQFDEAGSEKINVTLIGMVVDASTEEPISGAKVKVTLANKEKYTGEQGNFTFSNLYPGTYKIEVSHNNYEYLSNSVDIQDQQKKVVIRLKSKFP